MLPTDEQGRNVFHIAAANGVYKTVSKLLSSHKKFAGAALLAKDSQGRTPADVAAYCGNIRILRLLLDSTPDSGNSKTTDRRNYLDLLRHQDDTPFTFQIRTRLVAWGSTSIAGVNGLVCMDQPQLPGTGLDRFAPRSIVKLAVSPSQALAICQKNDFKRSVLGTRDLKPLDLQGRFLGACTAQHSVILTDRAAFTWGKNQYGQLAQDVKRADHPIQVDDFIDFRHSSLGGFEALASDMDRTPLEPLVDTECAPHYSIAWTTNKMYAWGLNSGQILGSSKGKVEPTLVYDFRQPIQSACCLDNAIVALSGYALSVFVDGDRRMPGISGSEVRGRGQLFAVLNESGRLFLYKLTHLNEPTKIPVPKSETIVSFDVAETGLVVISTKYSIYTWQRGELTEVSGANRYNIRKVCCDARGTSFLASQEYFVPPELMVGGTSLVEDLAGICPVQVFCSPRIPQSFSFFEDSGDFETGDVVFDWESLPQTRLESLNATVASNDGTKIPIHKSVLLGRCPRLTATLTTTRGGNTVRNHDGCRFEFSVSHEALLAFVQYLYTASPKDSPPNSLGKQYRDLQSLAEGSLAVGMLRSKAIDPDVTVNLCDGQVKAHSSILRARSVFFAARLSDNWKSNTVDLTQYTTAAFTHFMDFLYSGRVSKSISSIKGTEGQTFECLIEIWFLADELMHSQLADIVESALVECVNFDTCLDIINIMPGAKTLYNVALDFYARHMDYYVRELGKVPNSLSDVIETFYRKSYGKKLDVGDMTALITKLTPSAADLGALDRPASAPTSAPTSASTSAVNSTLNTPSSSAPPSAPISSRSSPEPKFQIAQGKRRGSQTAAKTTPKPSPSPSVAIPRTRPNASPSPSPSRSFTPVSPATPWRAPVHQPALTSPALPRLGQEASSSLPRLGEAKTSPNFRARTTSVPKRLSQKERRKLQQADNDTPVGAPPAPWVRPTVVASHSLSEQLAVLSNDRQRSARR